MKYPEELRDACVYRYLFEKDCSNKKLQHGVLSYPADNNGFEAMGILHYYGIGKKAGSLHGHDPIECIAELSVMDDDYRMIAGCISRYLDIQPDNDGLESVVVSKTKEKKKISYYTTRYERNLSNRREAIRIHGTKCMACGFDFQEVYGKIGQGFIEVHHIKPLSSRNEEVVIDPSTDLICVCSNCHRMIHRNPNQILTLNELRMILSDQHN